MNLLISLGLNQRDLAEKEGKRRELARKFFLLNRFSFANRYRRLQLCLPVTLLQFLLIASHFILSATVQASVISITDQGQISFNNQFETYEDHEHQLSVESLVEAFDLNLWEPPNPRNTNVGFNDSSYWLTAQLLNENPKAVKRILELQYPLLDEVEIALVHKGDIVYRYQTGDKYSHNHRPLADRYFLFPIDIPVGESRLFIRAATKGALNVPLKLWTEPALWQARAVSLLAQGSFFGILLVMCAYNGFLFFATRDRSYLYYVIYVAMFAAHQACVRGFAFQYAWPENLPWNDHVQDFFVIFTVTAALAFFKEFLSLSTQRPVLDRLLKLLIWGWILVGAVAVVLDKTVLVWISSMGTMVSVIVALACAVVLWIQGFRPAKLFLLAWLCLLVSVLIYITKNHGILPSNFFTEYSLQIGSVIEVCLLSFALADRITYLKRNEQNATELAIRAESEITAKKDFLSKVSHEIRTPMNGVLGMIQLLQITQLNGTQKRYADIIYRSAKALTNVISDILDYSKMEKGKLDLQLSNMNVRELMRDMQSIFAKPAAEKNIEIVQEVDSKLPETIRVDEVRVRQIFINIISNAIKFTDHGSVKLIAKPLGDEYINFEIEDTGSGMSQQQVDKVFAEHVDGDPSHTEGAGLGLVISRQLIELFGGELSIKATKQEGTSVSFYLPMVQPAEVSPEVSDEAAPYTKPVRSYSKTILVVDDDVPSQEVVQSMLQRMGHRVCVVENGQEALSAVKDNEQYWDMIFMDCEMPQMNGFEAVQRIREWEKEKGFEKAVVVGLSAHNHPTYLRRCIQSGMQTYLIKPIEFSDLKSIMRMNS